MSTGERLGQLIGRLEQEKTWKRDVIVAGSNLEYGLDGRLWIKAGGKDLNMKANKVTDVCHSHLSEKLVIPVSYYKRMLTTYPELLTQNINGWLQKSDQNYLLRTFQFDPETGGHARAFLSDRYQVLDNYDVLFAALEAIKEMKVKVEITKAEVTDRRLYLHVTCPDIEVDATEFLKQYMRNDPNAAVGNGIFAGMVMSNSEVGLGQFEIRPRAIVGKCTNGLVGADDRFKRIHLGAQMQQGEIAWSERTKQKNYELIISQTQDAIKTFLSPEYLNGMIKKVAEAHQIKLTHPVDTVQNICRELSITEGHKKAILDFFINDGDTRASGVFQAITRQAQAMAADDQYDVELGIGRMLPEIPKFDKPFSKS
jgi:hypothetical protein